MKVAKFGGTSLANAEQIRKVFGIIRSDPDRRLVVVSAPGKRSSSDIKVTDMLIGCAEARLKGAPTDELFGRLVERFADIQRGLGLPESSMEAVQRDLRARLEGPADDPRRYMDAMKAGGEDNSARLVADFFRQEGLEARYVEPGAAGLVLSEEYGNAQVLPESYAALKALRDIPGVTVFPGFFGKTRSGAVATFPRGGSDITGAILAAAVGANVYENFTDVDSVFAADPRVVPQAGPILSLTYREMRELAYAGFSVFHDEAIVPAVRARVPVCIKNTNRPDAPGTLIVPERSHVPGEVVGVVASAGFCTVFVSKYLMNREVGFGRRLLQIVEEEGLSYEHAPSGIDSMSLILNERSFDAARERRVTERIRHELDPDDVYVERGLALVMIVGEGMRHAVGMAARATAALAGAGVNIEMMNQGASEISMMYGISAADSAKALNALYAAFFPAGSRVREAT